MNIMNCVQTQTQTQTSTSNRNISTTWQYSISPSVLASQKISSSSISVISHSLYEHSEELPSFSPSPLTQTVLRFRDSIPSSSSSTLLFESLVAVVLVRLEPLLVLLPLTIVLVDIEHNVDCDLSIVAGGRINRIVCFQLFINFVHVEDHAQILWSKNLVQHKDEHLQKKMHLQHNWWSKCVTKLCIYYNTNCCFFFFFKLITVFYCFDDTFFFKLCSILKDISTTHLSEQSKNTIEVNLLNDRYYAIQLKICYPKKKQKPYEHIEKKKWKETLDFFSSEQANLKPKHIENVVVFSIFL